MQPEFRIVREEFHAMYEADADGNLVRDAAGNPVSVKKPALTFHVTTDGGATWFPSMKWYPECTRPGLSPDYYVRRCINRLLAGASREAFGGHEVVLDGPGGRQVVGRARADKPPRAEVREEDGPPRFETVATKHGPKRREVRKQFVAIVDGKQVGEAPTEQQAKGVCAVHAFMTRNRLGRLQHVLERLQECFPGRECKVWACCKVNGIRATVDGEDYAVGWLPPEKTASGEWEVEPAVQGSPIPWRFKKLVKE